jgi:hypothetical protein
MAQRLSRETLDWVKDYYRKYSMPASELGHCHGDCPAGIDTRSRLYTKLTEDRKKILCHCFNCGASGAVNVTGFLRNADPLYSDPAMVDAKDDQYDRELTAFEMAKQEYDLACPLFGVQNEAQASSGEELDCRVVKRT